MELYNRFSTGAIKRLKKRNSQNKTPLPNGKKNICGAGIKKLRKEKKGKFSQFDLASEMQKRGLAIDKNAISKIESGDRYVSDFELQTLAEIFGLTMDELVEISALDNGES